MFGTEFYYKYLQRNDYVYSIYTHNCGSNKWRVVFIDNFKIILECIKCYKQIELAKATFLDDFRFKQIPYEKIILKKTEDINLIKYIDVLVVSNINHCEYNSHSPKDLRAQIQTFLEDGTISTQYIETTYCDKCNKYFILSDTYKDLKGIPVCSVFDNTISKDHIYSSTKSMYENESKSILTRHGYNVKSNSKLSKPQRRSILVAVLKNKELTKNQVFSHINSCIQRGEKIPSWSNAVVKWKSDIEFLKKLKFDYDNSTEYLVNSITIK